MVLAANFEALGHSDLSCAPCQSSDERPFGCGWINRAKLCLWCSAPEVPLGNAEQLWHFREGVTYLLPRRGCCHSCLKGSAVRVFTHHPLVCIFPLFSIARGMGRKEVSVHPVPFPQPCPLTGKASCSCLISVCSCPTKVLQYWMLELDQFDQNQLFKNTSYSPNKYHRSGLNHLPSSHNCSGYKIWRET